MILASDGASPPMTLMALWLLHKAECRAVGTIVAEARAGDMPGIEQSPSGFGFIVKDEKAALAAMRRPR